MQKHPLTMPEIAAVAGTRALLGMGIGLLLAEKMNGQARRNIGWGLLAIGAISTIPLARHVLSRHEAEPEAAGPTKHPQHRSVRSSRDAVMRAAVAARPEV